MRFLSAVSGCDVSDSDERPDVLKKSRSRSRSANAREPQRPWVFVGPPRICGKASKFDALYVAPEPAPKNAPKKRGLGSGSPRASKGKQLKMDQFIG